MKLRLSLKQSWTVIILIAVIVPASSISLWFGSQLYHSQLNSALLIEKQENDALKSQIYSEFDRLKTTLINKSDPLSVLINDYTDPQNLQSISHYLGLILQRDSAFREVILFSEDLSIIAALDPYIGLTSDLNISIEQQQSLKEHWGIDTNNAPPELVVPFLDRTYISSPKKHDDFMAANLAVPIGSPVKAVLIVTIDINRLWLSDNIKLDTHAAQKYLLDSRGALLSASNNEQYKQGDLMTHMDIARSALMHQPFPLDHSYLGINNQPVFGTLTTIPVLNWTLISEVNKRNITPAIKSVLKKSAIAITLCLILFIWAALVLARKTIKPIQALEHATQEISHGNYHIHLALSGIREFDTLAVNFNIMARARKEAEERLQLSDRVFKESHDGITITDAHANIIDINPTFTDITGYSREDVIGRNPSMLNSGKQSPEFYAEMWQTINGHGHWTGEVWNRKKSGELYAELLTISTLKDDNGTILHYVGIFSDITHNKHQQQELELMAHYDVLTKLPNRTLFADRFSQAIAHSNRTQTQLGICFLDLDKFKPINDNYGHEVGDQLLIEVARRLKESIREEDSLSRQGGDEFTILLGDIESYSECEKTLERIHRALAKPYLINEVYHEITASSGITLYPSDSGDVDTLLRHADQAMYLAKQSGRNKYYRFNTQQDQDANYKHHRLNEIQQALQNNELALYYQPKVNMITGKVFGAEALIRWLHPEKGLIPPLEFLPLIENTDLDIEVGNWVINQALKQLDLWNSQGINLEVSINISSLHLLSAQFINHLEQNLDLYPSVESKWLQLEILESSALGDLNAISTIIKTCQNGLGLNVALDDFGTGYSSLTHLRNLPVNTIKIDQSFVRDMLDDPSDYAIIDGVIGLSDSFNRHVIAEGVETTAHGIMLLIMGCHSAQGYGIAKPMPAEEFPDWLRSYQPNAEWRSCGQNHNSVKENNATLFKLISQQWEKRFIESINSPPDKNKAFPLLDNKQCHCGSWIKRAKHDQLFEAHWLHNLDDKHRALHQYASDLHTSYQDGNIDSAREGLDNLEKLFEEMLTWGSMNDWDILI